MDILHLLGRILFGGFFIYNASQHFMSLEGIKGYAASKGVPAPGLAVAGSGMLLLLGGTSVLFGLWPRIGLALLILFLVPVTFMMHNFWAVPEDQKEAEMVNFAKNMGLAGAALVMMLGAGSWPYTLS